MGIGHFVTTFVQPGELSANMLFGRPVVGHLWFLMALLLFYWLAASFDALVRPRLPQWLHKAVLPMLRHKWLWVLVVGGAVAAVRSVLVRGAGWDTDVVNVLLYLPYFAVGAVAFATPERFAAFLRIGWIDLLAFAASTAVLAVPPVRAHVPGALMLLVQLCFALVLTVLLLRLFQRLLNRPSPLQQRLVDASYSVYLFHHIIVVGMALLLMPLRDMPALAKYAVVVSTAIGVPLALHLGVIARFPLMRWLFNGRQPKRQKAPGAHTAPASTAGLAPAAEAVPAAHPTATTGG